MNYYERHLGDYHRDAGHLTLAEHGAYTLLLDRYYTTEQPIPADQVYRVCRARLPAERAAVDAVLAEFWLLADGCWRNRRADEEMAAARRRIEAARTNGAKGGRPRAIQPGTQREPTGLAMGNPGLTQSKAHQSPSTKHQAPENTHTEASPARESAPPRGASALAPGVEVVSALRRAGLPDGNAHHPELAALIADGATVDEFLSLLPKAQQNATGSVFAYLLRTVAGCRQRAKALATVPPPPPGSAFPTVNPAGHPADDRPPPRWRLLRARRNVEASGEWADPESREIVQRWGLTDTCASAQDLRDVGVVIEGDFRAIPAKLG